MTRRGEQQREELVTKLEALHQLTVEADAFHAAFETIYGETSWPSNKDPERRRALNRMSCHVDQLRVTIDALLHESKEVVEMAMKRGR